MKRVVAAGLFGLLGLLVPVLAVVGTENLGLAPRFPVFAGEDDFSVRIAYFMFLVLPAFLLIGVWMGIVYDAQRRLVGRMFAGVLLGTLLAFAVVHALSTSIGGIQSRDAANSAVLVFLLSWVGLSALGAWIGYRSRGLTRSTGPT
jgi:hypothetical protein